MTVVEFELDGSSCGRSTGSHALHSRDAAAAPTGSSKGRVPSIRRRCVPRPQVNDAVQGLPASREPWDQSATSDRVAGFTGTPQEPGPKPLTRVGSPGHVTKLLTEAAAYNLPLTSGWADAHCRFGNSI